ncbi:MAG: hypothetical protein WD512_08375, partial [Candidatus Paceibacterota bacterium]
MNTIYPQELQQIQNPDVRKIYEVSYKLFLIKIDNIDYEMLLDKQYDYIIIMKSTKTDIRIKKVIASHNVIIDDVIRSHDKAYYLKLDNLMPELESGQGLGPGPGPGPITTWAPFNASGQRKGPGEALGSCPGISQVQVLEQENGLDLGLA